MNPVQEITKEMAGIADRDFLLAKAKEFHGDLCAGIVLGTRMTVIGMRELGMDPKIRNRDLIVYVEIDRCIADAIQAITGCSLGHRSLKYRPYGKFAATYVNIKNGDAVRVSVVEKKRTDKTGPGGNEGGSKDSARGPGGRPVPAQKGQG